MKIYCGAEVRHSLCLRLYIYRHGQTRESASASQLLTPSPRPPHAPLQSRKMSPVYIQGCSRGQGIGRGGGRREVGRGATYWGVGLVVVGVDGNPFLHLTSTNTYHTHQGSDTPALVSFLPSLILHSLVSSNNVRV